MIIESNHKHQRAANNSSGRKRGSNPCQLLRKEFGSYVATSFGLFVAQRYLGHSNPTVTKAFYAGLTNLPELKHAKIPQRASQPSN